MIPWASGLGHETFNLVIAGSNPAGITNFERTTMATLEDVNIQFQCKHCKSKSNMTASELMEAGIEGPPYCICSDDDLDVINVKMGVLANGATSENGRMG